MAYQLQARAVGYTTDYSNVRSTPGVHDQSRRLINHLLRSFLSFPIALIPRLKSLFVIIPNSPNQSHGPDGLPPLSFLLDTATFIGNASVPLGLVCLGSALARLNVPKPWTRLPLGAIGVFTIVKLFVMPVLGVLICDLFTTKMGLINKEDKVLRFVCM